MSSCKAIVYGCNYLRHSVPASTCNNLYDESKFILKPVNYLLCKLVNSHLQFYTFLETTLVAASLLPRFLAFFSNILGDPGTLATTFLVFVLNLAFSLSLFGFLIMHLSLVARNTSTIEAFEKKTSPRWRYDLGRWKNFEQVFGTEKLYWFIPAYSLKDLALMPSLHGLDYPTKPDAVQEF
uniref:Protein S-acyltransferase n=1 Tax=Kalanchoe fedtschenkoi TaxID=63787 RepID=A0A7N0UFB0_KALFE